MISGLSTTSTTRLNHNVSTTYDNIIESTSFYSQTYFNSSILIIGTIFVVKLLNFTQCDVTFLRNNSIVTSGIHLNSNSSLILDNSVFHVNSDSFTLNISNSPLIRSVFNSTISISNSTMYSNINFKDAFFYLNEGLKFQVVNSFFYNFSLLLQTPSITDIYIHYCGFYSPNSNLISINKGKNFYFTNNYVFANKNPLQSLFNINNIQIVAINSNILVLKPFNIIQNQNQDYLFICTNISQFNVFNNSFDSFQFLFHLSNSLIITVTLNNFSYFTIAFSLMNFNSSLFSKNSFISGANPFYLPNLDLKFQLNCTLNNFYFFNSIISIEKQQQKNITSYLSFSYNYYSDFNPIKSDNSGISNFPYRSEYFTDYHPLMYSFENYELLGNEIVLKSNGYYNESLSEQNLFIIDNQLLLIILFYGSLLISPLLVLLIYKKTSKKYGLKERV